VHSCFEVFVHLSAFLFLNICIVVRNSVPRYLQSKAKFAKNVLSNGCLYHLLVRLGTIIDDARSDFRALLSINSTRASVLCPT
jgi:hypothetical protein